MGETSVKIHLLAGDYKLKLTKSGYAPMLKSIQVRPPNAVRANAEATGQWNARVAAVEEHNAGISQQVREANAEAGLGDE